MNKSYRVESVDILRGMAAIMVVFFHTLQRFPHAGNNMLFHICFSIQIPLFILISGYTTSFSHPITDMASLWSHCKKRLLVLLLPWVVWSFIAYWLFHTDVSLPIYIKTTAYRLEGSYWFLFTLWIIDIVHSLASIGSNIIKTRYNILIYSLLYFVGGGAVALVGYKLGMTFLGVQYTLYYMPFFFLGYLVGRYKKKAWCSNAIFQSILFGVLCIIYFLVVPRFGFTEIPYTSYFLLVRMGLSLAGCFCLVWFVNHINWMKTTKLKKILLWSGRFSLEIYVIHLIVLHFLHKSDKAADTVEGFLICIANFIIVYLTTVLLVKLFHSNKYTSKLLFGKE